MWGQKIILDRSFIIFESNHLIGLDEYFYFRKILLESSSPGLFKNCPYFFSFLFRHLGFDILYKYYNVYKIINYKYKREKIITHYLFTINTTKFKLEVFICMSTYPMFSNFILFIRYYRFLCSSFEEKETSKVIFCEINYFFVTLGIAIYYYYATPDNVTNFGPFNLLILLLKSIKIIIHCVKNFIGISIPFLEPKSNKNLTNKKNLKSNQTTNQFSFEYKFET